MLRLTSGVLTPVPHTLSCSAQGLIYFFNNCFRNRPFSVNLPSGNAVSCERYLFSYFPSGPAFGSIMEGVYVCYVQNFSTVCFWSILYRSSPFPLLRVCTSHLYFQPLLHLFLNRRLGPFSCHVPHSVNPHTAIPIACYFFFFVSYYNKDNNSFIKKRSHVYLICGVLPP
jgi:hypothetical protein